MGSRRTDATGGGGERGAVLVSTLYVAVITAALAVAMQIVTKSSYEDRRAAVEESRAHYGAEAGLAEAVALISGGGDGAIASPQAPRALGGASYWVESYALAGGQVSLIATADVGQHRAIIESIVQPIPPAPWTQYGVFGKDSVALTSACNVDSFDSSQGPYGPGNQSADAVVGSNANVSVTSNSHVQGDALAGPAGTVTVDGSSSVNGTQGNLTDPQTFPTIDVPVLPSLGPLSLNGGATQTLPPGSYRYDDITINGTCQLTVEGPAVLVMDALTLHSGANLVLDTTNGPVTVYGTGDFWIDSGAAFTNTTLDPTQLEVFLTSSPTDTVFLNSGSTMYGVIYAPDALVDVRSDTDVYGALVASQVSLTSGCDVHFDLALAAGTANGPGRVPPDPVAWRILTQAEKDALVGGWHPYDTR